MHERDFETLLTRYRPAAPRAELAAAITRLPNYQITRYPRTWPWAVAAAALLAISVGLHSAELETDDAGRTVALDNQRVRAVAEALGGAGGSRVMAEWIVRQEVRAERDAESARARASVQEFDRQ